MRWIICIVIILTIGSCVNSCNENRNWENFKKKHHCKIIERMDGSFSFGVSSRGDTVPMYNDGKECWLCDDGIKYWKEK